MKVTIGDLDYYFAEVKGLVVNADAQKISSYHKQKGDSVNFVCGERDIYRPYDIYYIIKENKDTPNPPMEFFANPKVRGCGEAFKMKRNWTMSDAMLACRPDYLLYPERLSRDSRAEQIRLLGNSNTLLPMTQDGSNTLKDKNYIITDKRLGYVDISTVKEALKKIKDVPNVCFESAIPLKYIRNNEIGEDFKELKISARSQIQGTRVFADEALEVLEIMDEYRRIFPTAIIPHLPVKYSRIPWKTMEEAQKGLKLLMQIAVCAKQQGFYLDIIGPKERDETPFFFLIELMEDGCKLNFKLSWLEYLSIRFKVEKNYMSGTTEGNKPNKWHPLFRDAIRQTYENKEFLLLRGEHDKLSELEIPWKLGKDSFKLGL